MQTCIFISTQTKYYNVEQDKMGIQADLNNRSQVIKFTWIILIHSENFISRFFIFISHRTYSFSQQCGAIHNTVTAANHRNASVAAKRERNTRKIIWRILFSLFSLLFSWINCIKFIGLKLVSRCALYAAYCVYMSARAFVCFRI